MLQVEECLRREGKKMWPVAELKGDRSQLFPALLLCLKPLSH